MNRRMKLLTKRVLAFLLVLTFVISTVSIAFAKDNEISEDMSDEEWDKIKDEMADIDNDPDWDHETWDEDHKELVWTVFATTSWNEDSFPSLNFSTMDGVGSVSINYLSSEEQTFITDTIKGYKYTTGKYSKKTTTDETTIVDNSAYIPIVMVAVDTLKSHGSGNDPYATEKYLTRNSKTGLLHTYDTSKRSEDAVLKSVMLEVYRRIVNAEKIYDSKHTEKSNIYQKTNDGLLVMMQSVVYSTTFARDVSSYSESEADSWFDDSSRKKAGYSSYNDFALVTTSSYDCAETIGTYIMDGFGHRIDTN